MFHHFPSYDPPPNLIGSCANVVQLSIPVNSGNAIIICKSVSAQTLDCLIGHSHCTRGSVQKHCRTICVRNSLGFVDCLRNRVHVSTRRLEFHKHVSYFTYINNTLPCISWKFPIFCLNCSRVCK